MKKISKLFVIAGVCLMAALGLAACGRANAYIKVDSPGHQVIYRENAAELNLTGLTIRHTAEDKTKTTVEVTADMVSGFDANKLDVLQTVVIAYDGMITTYSVLVIADDTLAGLVRLEHDKWFFTGYSGQSEKFGDGFADFEGFNSLFDAAFDEIYFAEFEQHWNDTIANAYLWDTPDGLYQKEFDKLAAFGDVEPASRTDEEKEFMDKYFASDFALAEPADFGGFIHSEMQDNESKWYFDQAAALARGEADAHAAAKEALAAEYGVADFEDVWQAIYDTEIAKYEGMRTAICDWARAQLLAKTPAYLFPLIQE